MNNEMTNNTPFKVKCVISPSSEALTKGKEYEVISVEYLVDDNYYEIVDDNGDSRWYFASRFEIVETLKGKQEFSVGDKVYVGLTGRVAQVTEIVDDNVVSVANKHNEVRAWVSNICHATQENYEMLLKLYPHIEFELPPNPLT